MNRIGVRRAHRNRLSRTTFAGKPSLRQSRSRNDVRRGGSLAGQYGLQMR
ncbi:hypothetical protein C7S14_7970 [Burkholderia cepacia]|nr:hypothetical protein C7S14_7970 [Burkholderia cepacia]